MYFELLCEDTTGTMSIERANIPISHARYALKEEKERLKLLEQLCSFLEEQSDIENRFGLGFQKVTILYHDLSH